MDKPWEMVRFGGWSYGNVIRNQHTGIFRMWYKPFRFGTAVAESTDGINWRKPMLGLVGNVTLLPSHKGASKHEWPAGTRRIDIPVDSNVLPVGLGSFIGDVLVPTRSRSGGMQAGLQCLHSKVWLQTYWPKPKKYLGGWLDVCGATSTHGLQWQSATTGAKVTQVRDQQLRVPYNDEQQQIEPMLMQMKHSVDAIAPGPADSYTQIEPVDTADGIKHVLYTRRNFATADPFTGIKWRGARGLRVLAHRGKHITQDPQGWTLRNEFLLDMQFGPQEVHRRQVAVHATS